MSSWKTSGKVRILGIGAIGFFSWDGKAEFPVDFSIWRIRCCLFSITPIPDLIPADLQENQNIWIWKGSMGIIESTSWPCTDNSNNSTIKTFSKVFLNSGGLGAVTIPWGCCSKEGIPTQIYPQHCSIITKFLSWL